MQGSGSVSQLYSIPCGDVPKLAVVQIAVNTMSEPTICAKCGELGRTSDGERMLGIVKIGKLRGLVAPTECIQGKFDAA